MIAVSFLCGLALALAFPRAGLGLLGWFAPVPWIAVLVRVSPARGFRLGFAFGAGFFGLLLAWVHAVLTHYTSLPLALTIPIWLLLITYLAAYTALFGWLVSGLSRRMGRAALLLAPFLWVGLEFARGRLLGGFPWGAAGYARTGGLALKQAASVGGEALVSFLLAATWCALAVWFPWAADSPAQQTALRENRRVGRVLESTRSRPDGFRRLAARVIAAAALAVVGGVAALGALRLGRHKLEGEAAVVGDRRVPRIESRRTDCEVRVALVQGGVGGDLSYEEGKRALSTYIDLSRLAASGGQDLIVWPESNAPFLPEGTPGYLETLEAVSRESGCPLLLGGVGGSEKDGLTNSAFLIGPDGVRARYDKRRLVQYGEYVPLKQLFPFIRHFVPETGEFRPGLAVGVMTVGAHRLGVSICYEVIFPEEILLQARAGAAILINLTNDSWYRWGGPWQHSEFAVLRAIESGLYLARAASTGRTLVIDPLGRTIASGALGGEAILEARIPIRAVSVPAECTIFVRSGEWAGIGCATITGLALAFLVVGNIIDSSTARGARRPSGKEPDL